MPPRIASSGKSTNVRMKGAAGASACPLAVTLLCWAGAVSLGAFDGVFARLPAPVDLGLAVFAALFAAGAYALDRELRACVDAAPAAFLVFVAVAGDALGALVASQGIAAMAHAAPALAAFFAAPLGLAASVPALRAIARRFSSAPGRSPGASPAAT